MPINFWTARSLELANHHDYLDRLFRVYPVHINHRRSLPELATKAIERYYLDHDFIQLIKVLLSQKIFPIKDSYVAYLRHDPGALERNPSTVNRLAGTLYEIGLAEIFNKAGSPIESNRQTGPSFKNWLQSGVLGCPIAREPEEFMNSTQNSIFLHSDAKMKDLAARYLGYDHGKGLDFIGKFNSKFVIGEAKFLSDFGGHQAAQFNDAISTVEATLRPTQYAVIKIAVLDGVLYIHGRNYLHRSLLRHARVHPILSALFLREFLYSL